MATDTNVKSLIINKMTKAQYDAATKSPNELYFVTGDTPEFSYQVLSEDNYQALVDAGTVDADTLYFIKES